ncbi:hypothetical protein AAXE64_08280 [Priestia megaterium]
MKNREEVMNEYYKNVTKEQLIKDIEKAGMIVKENKCKKCKELNEKWGNEYYEAICWDCHDKRVDEYEKNLK